MKNQEKMQKEVEELKLNFNKDIESMKKFFNKKIEEVIKKYSEEEVNDKPALNIITQYPSEDNAECKINNITAFRLFTRKNHIEKFYNKVEEIIQQLCTVYLFSNDDGQWYDENCKKISGRLYYKQHKK